VVPLMSFDVQLSIPFKRIGTPKVMIKLLVLIVKFLEFNDTYSIPKSLRFKHRWR
jgi:hypothetical protein